mmetsp:Transcript_8833/g.14697  ORF Transcript_8833/g.14697 Transcript_8833/m.14697 type:complete len:1052 (-) Transcript_8833:209-3364(-)
MIHSIAGFHREHVVLVVEVLCSTDNKDLANLFIDTISTIDAVLAIILKEMFTTRQNILYWTDLARSPSWELYCYKINSRIFRALFDASTDSSRYEVLYRSEDMLQHAEVLRADFSKLSLFLERINDAASLLKAIYVESVAFFPLLSAHDDEDEAENFHRRKDRNEQYIRDITHVHVEQCLLKIVKCFEDYVPDLVCKFSASTKRSGDDDSVYGKVGDAAIAVDPAPAAGDEDGVAGASSGIVGALNPSGKDSYLSKNELAGLSARVEEFLDFVIDTRGNKPLPMEFTKVVVHKPSDRERYWMRSVLITLAGIMSAQLLYNMYYDGTLALSLKWVQAKFHDHLYEPVSELGRELFNTISKREYVVTREELEESRTALHRMLEDFSQSRRGYLLILSDLKNSALNTVTGSADPNASAGTTPVASIGNGSGVSSGSTAGGLSTSVGTNTATGASAAAGGVPGVDVVSRQEAGGGGGVYSTYTAEQAMNALMSEYEKELQTPVMGIMFGSLMTAILIQMQKLKVHTEAAMLTMDQILTSNELTIAATAAMPAFAFIGAMIMSLRSALQPPASARSTASYTEHFRLIMSDVERSLQEVQELTALMKSDRVGRKGRVIEQNRITYSLMNGYYNGNINAHRSRPRNRGSRSSLILEGGEGSGSDSESETATGTGGGGRSIDGSDGDACGDAGSGPLSIDADDLLLGLGAIRGADQNLDAIRAKEDGGSTPSGGVGERGDGVGYGMTATGSARATVSSHYERRLQEAKGMLRFHLVRLRSKFQSLFQQGAARDGGSGGGGGGMAGDDISRATPQKSESTRISRLSNPTSHYQPRHQDNLSARFSSSRGRMRKNSSSFGSFASFSPPGRLMSSLPIGNSSSLFFQQFLQQQHQEQQGGQQPLPTPSSRTKPNFTHSQVGSGRQSGGRGSSTTSSINRSRSSQGAMVGEEKPTTGNASRPSTTEIAIEANSVDPMTRMLILTQPQSDFTLWSTLSSFMNSLYTMLFGGYNEFLTHTTQYNSLHRDITLLESPEFEVSLERKLCTAARMRVSYNCLLPAHSK